MISENEEKAGAEAGPRGAQVTVADIVGGQSSYPLPFSGVMTWRGRSWRHGADDFRREPQAASMRRAIVGKPAHAAAGSRTMTWLGVELSHW